VTCKKLDNPVWHSLSETHKVLSIDYGSAMFYDPSYCPFGAFTKEEGLIDAVDKYSTFAGDFFIVGKKPEFPQKLSLKKELVCLQMVCEERIDICISESIIPLNSKTGADAFFNLVNKVQPGYIRNNTIHLGDYFGIYKDEVLVAATGERMKMEGLTEVSAVVTHPDHTGKGFAKQLVAYTVNKIFRENKIPFLHVAESNVPAITLYEKMGFGTRRKISFWNLVRTVE